MKDFLPYFTNDGSVGLYSKDDNDIYHSTYGALSEAYEKFIIPSNISEVIKNQSEIKILDICYGIGYNSKSFLNFFLDNSSPSNKYNSTIYTDNILPKKVEEIFIHAVDTNEFLLKLSPFIKTNEKNFRRSQIGINSVDKLLKNNIMTTGNKYKISDEIKMILIIKLIEHYKETFFDDNLTSILKNKKYNKYFEQKLINFAYFYKNNGCKTSFNHFKSTYLHNIYYQYVSRSYKNVLKILKTKNININFDIIDARSALKTSNLVYDFIFLDAFTPAKMPCLWTFEFFKEIYNHLSQNGILTTYSNSAAVRNAFLQNGFYVGKIYDKTLKKFIGTIASKNKQFINYKLNDYDLGLINSRAGLMYRDLDFNLTNEEIITNRNIEIDKSDLISTSQFIKQFKGDKNAI